MRLRIPVELKSGAVSWWYDSSIKLYFADYPGTSILVS